MFSDTNKLSELLNSMYFTTLFLRAYNIIDIMLHLERQ